MHCVEARGLVSDSIGCMVLQAIRRTILASKMQVTSGRLLFDWLAVSLYQRKLPMSKEGTKEKLLLFVHYGNGVKV